MTDYIKSEMQAAIDTIRNQYNKEIASTKITELKTKHIQSMSPAETLEFFRANMESIPPRVMGDLGPSQIHALTIEGLILKLTDKQLQGIDKGKLAYSKYLCTNQEDEKKIEYLVLYRYTIGFDEWGELNAQQQSTIKDWINTLSDINKPVPSQLQISELSKEAVILVNKLYNKIKLALNEDPSNYLSKPINEMSKEEIQSIPIRYFEILNFQSLTFQSQQWSTDQLSKLSSDQIAALSAEQIVEGLSNEITVNFNDEQKQALSQKFGKNSSLYNALTLPIRSDNISELTSEQILCLSPAQILNLKDKISATNQFSTNQIRLMSASQLDALTKIIPDFPREYKVKTQDINSSLSPLQIRALTSHQIQSLSAAQLHGLDFSYFSVSQLSKLKPLQITNLDHAQVMTLKVILGNHITTIFNARYGKENEIKFCQDHSNLAMLYGLIIARKGFLEDKDPDDNFVNTDPMYLPGQAMQQQVMVDMFQRKAIREFIYIDSDGKNHDYSELFGKQPNEGEEFVNYNDRINELLNNPPADILRFYQDSPNLFNNLWGLTHQGVIATAMTGATTSIHEDPLCKKLGLQLFQDNTVMQISHEVGREKTTLVGKAGYRVAYIDEKGNKHNLCRLKLGISYSANTSTFEKADVDQMSSVSTFNFERSFSIYT